MKQKYKTIIGMAVFCLLVLSTKSYAQNQNKDTAHVFVRSDLKINKFYSKSELEKLPKLDLISIYKNRLEYLIEVLPFLSLHPKPGSTFHDMSIPETQENIYHLDKETENKQGFITSLFATLDDVVPYSEKENIIWCIMFFEEMIKKSDYVK